MAILNYVAERKGGTEWHFSGTEQHGTERQDRMAFPRDRTAMGQKAGQNVWNKRAGTERLGSPIYAMLICTKN